MDLSWQGSNWCLWQNLKEGFISKERDDSRPQRPHRNTIMESSYDCFLHGSVTPRGQWVNRLLVYLPIARVQIAEVFVHSAVVQLIKWSTATSAFISLTQHLHARVQFHVHGFNCIASKNGPSPSRGLRSVSARWTSPAIDLVSRTWDVLWLYTLEMKLVCSFIPPFSLFCLLVTLGIRTSGVLFVTKLR